MREYRTIDKSAWPAGEWQQEPDKRQWADDATGLPCLLVRGPHGALCGYVGVPEGHPWYRMAYDDVPLETGVHGGLTYAAHCQHSEDESRHICHIPEPGQPDNVWWLGFDCAHADDICPRHDPMEWMGKPTGWGSVYAYRNAAYVASECANLAKQIADA